MIEEISTTNKKAWLEEDSEAIAIKIKNWWNFWLDYGEERTFLLMIKKSLLEKGIDLDAE